MEQNASKDKQASGGREGIAAEWTPPKLLSQLRDYYALLLKQTPAAQQYLKSRGVSDEVAAKFKLGFVSWKRLPHPGIFDMRDKTAAGIYKDYGFLSAKGREKFHNRITFPFYAKEGDEIRGFATRAIDTPPKGMPAHLRTSYPPETGVVDIQPLCWGNSRDAIEKANEVVVVEGVFDALALQSAGFCQTVGLQGSASQIDGEFFSRIANNGKNVVFLMDRDYGGNEGRWKALSEIAPLLREGADENIRFATLPKGTNDPAGMIEKMGREEGRKAIQEVLRKQHALPEEVSWRLQKRAPVEYLIHAANRVKGILNAFEVENLISAKIAQVLEARTGAEAMLSREAGTER